MGLHSVILRGWPKDLRTGWLKVKVTEKDLRLGFLMDFPMGFGLVKQKAMPTVKRTGLLMVIPIQKVIDLVTPKGSRLEMRLGFGLDSVIVMETLRG